MRIDDSRDDGQVRNVDDFGAGRVDMRAEIRCGPGKHDAFAEHGERAVRSGLDLPLRMAAAGSRAGAREQLAAMAVYDIRQSLL